jgi:hypothetical protein
MDPALEPLVQQLRNHLESLESNHNQVNGLTDAINGVEAAVEGFFSHKVSSTL